MNRVVNCPNALLLADRQLAAMLTVFSLAGLAGYQAVLGVPPALHSPLMSATNAISGMTAVGAMFLLPTSSMVPRGAAQLLGAAALVLSAVNVSDFDWESQWYDQPVSIECQ